MKKYLTLCIISVIFLIPNFASSTKTDEKKSRELREVDTVLSKGHINQEEATAMRNSTLGQEYDPTAVAEIAKSLRRRGKPGSNPNGDTGTATFNTSPYILPEDMRSSSDALGLYRGHRDLLDSNFNYGGSQNFLINDVQEIAKIVKATEEAIQEVCDENGEVDTQAPNANSIGVATDVDARKPIELIKRYSQIAQIGTDLVIDQFNQSNTQYLEATDSFCEQSKSTVAKQCADFKDIQTKSQLNPFQYAHGRPPAIESDEQKSKDHHPREGLLVPQTSPESNAFVGSEATLIPSSPSSPQDRPTLRYPVEREAQANNHIKS